MRLSAQREMLSRWFAAIPLRVGLVVALVLLAALGLFVSGVAVTTALEKSLLTKVDQQLRIAAQDWARPRPMKRWVLADGAVVWVRADRPNRQITPTPGTIREPDRFFVWARDTTGQTVLGRNPKGAVGPDLPDRSPKGPTTVGSTDGSPVEWRVLTITNSNGTTTIGLPLEDNQETVERLVLFQLGIGVVVLLALGLATFFVIRRSLRPLRTVESTAEAIAAGDLHRRVPVRGTNTEVDRLAQALNLMLAQIQHGVTATEASEEAARRSEAKMRRFVADASHELRTPLTTIRGFAELYRQGALTDTAMLMNRIESESARMGLLVEDLLMLARMDAQRPLERRPVDLLKLAGDAVHNARALVARTGTPERSIGLEIADGDGTLEIVGDQARLQQVLTNLIGNALTHTPPEADVTVRLTPSADTVLIEVVDTGPGLSEEAAERVFERFYRTDTSRTRASGGSGLGLSIVQSLVVAHNGTVRVESSAGAGTTFVVELPRASGESDSRTGPPEPAALQLQSGTPAP